MSDAREPAIRISIGLWGEVDKGAGGWGVVTCCEVDKGVRDTVLELVVGL